MQAQLNQIQKIVQDGQHLATIGVNVVGDVNDALERVTGMDHDGDGMVRQQPLRECRSWHYVFPCVDMRRGWVVCRSEGARACEKASVGGLQASETTLSPTSGK